MTEPNVICCDQFFAHSPAEVWRALTEPEMLARWWAPGDVRPLVGHRFTMDMGEWGKRACEVTEVKPGELISYSFGEGSINTIITWRIVPEGTGTRLFLRHSGFDVDSSLGRTAYEGMGSGWPHVVARIDGALETARR